MQMQPTDTARSREIRIGVFGATGTTGVELVQRLLGHNQCRLVFATSREYAGQTLNAVDSAAPAFPLVAPDATLSRDVDCVFTCLPHGHSAEWVDKILALSDAPTVIDLSGDYRLKSEAQHERIYGSPRSSDYAAAAAYGLTELNRDNLRNARLIANPGCYPTCTGLALAPLARSGALGDFLSIDAKSGISGAGRSANAATHFIQVHDDVKPYKLGREHRHCAEIEQLLTENGHDGKFAFNPHVVPLERGMLATIVARVPDLTAKAVHETLLHSYRDEPFVEVLPFGTAARMRMTARSNRVCLGVSPVEGCDMVVLTSSLDNLVKGASGQAMQNMNLAFGIAETRGFEHELVGRQS